MIAQNYPSIRMFIFGIAFRFFQTFLSSLFQTFLRFLIPIIFTDLWCHGVKNRFDPFLNFAKCSHYLFEWTELTEEGNKVTKTSQLHVLADINFALCAVIFLISLVSASSFYCSAVYGKMVFPVLISYSASAAGD